MSEVNLAGKRVFIRSDLNVPQDDALAITDDTRIRASVPAIRQALDAGAAVMVTSHLGRPTEGKVEPADSLAPVAKRLGELLGREVPLRSNWIDGVDVAPGQVVLLENCRCNKGEKKNDEALGRKMAALCDVYVNDAFGTAHRAHASTVGVAEILPAYAGLLMEREIANLSKLLEDPVKPFAAVIGGAKVSGKIKVLEHLMDKVDLFVIGGGMANTFLVAKGHSVGKSLLEKDRVDDAARILSAAEARGVRILLPTDIVVAKEVTRGAEHKIVPVHKIPNSWSAVDVGPASTAAFEEALASARTIVWNGPLGVFEVPTFGDGTRAMARFLSRHAQAGNTVVVGGGDSVAAIEELKLADTFTHVSTGGGASLEFLEGQELPGIKILRDRTAA